MIEKILAESALGDNAQRTVPIDDLNVPFVGALRSNRSVERFVERLDGRMGKQIDTLEEAFALFPIPLRSQPRCSHYIGELQRPVDRFKMGEDLIELRLAPEPLQLFPCLSARTSGQPGELLFRGGHAGTKV